MIRAESGGSASIDIKIVYSWAILKGLPIFFEFYDKLFVRMEIKPYVCNLKRNGLLITIKNY